MESLRTELVKIVDMEILRDKREKGRKGKVVLSEKNCQQHQRDSLKNVTGKNMRVLFTSFSFGENGSNNKNPVARRDEKIAP